MVSSQISIVKLANEESEMQHLSAYARGAKGGSVARSTSQVNREQGEQNWGGGFGRLVALVGKGNIWAVIGARFRRWARAYILG